MTQYNFYPYWRYMCGLLCLCIVSPSLQAEWQHRLPQGNSLYKIQCVSASRAFIVGEAESILRSDDAGATWDVRSSLIMERNRRLRSVSFSSVNSNIGIATGTYYSSYLKNNGASVTQVSAMFRTQDGGETWENVINSAFNGIRLNAVAFAIGSSTTIVASGVSDVDGSRFFLRSTDGGNTWNSSTSVNVDVQDIYFRTASSGFAVGEGDTTILRTIDGGLTWNTFSTIKTHLYDIDFASNSTLGYAVGRYGGIFQTINGGGTWSSVSYGNPFTWEKMGLSADNCRWDGVSFVGTTENAIVVGDYGTIFRYNAATNTWSEIYSGTREKLKSVDFFDNNNGIIVGSLGIVLRTTDGGLSWTVLNEGHNNCLNGVYFTDANQGVVIGDRGTILRTTNGGTTWNAVASATRKSLYGIHFSSTSVGTIVGDGGTILRTTDGGSIWHTQYSGVKEDLKAVCFADQDNGVIVGAHGTLLYTTDGGGRWLPAAISSTTSWGNRNHTTLYSVTFSNGEYIAVGSYGAILSSFNNAGGLWDVIRTDVTNDLVYRTTYWESTAPAAAGYEYRSNGKGATRGVRKRRLGGTGSLSWLTLGFNISQELLSPSATISLGYTDWFYAACRASNGDEFIVGQNGAIIRKMNGSSDWTLQNSGTRWSLRGVHFPTATTGYAVGMNGTILRTTDGGTYWGRINPPGPVPILTNVDDVSKNSEQQRIELVNKPNPAHGITDISFTMSVASNIKMRLYDKLGNEVRSLMNEFKTPGYYTLSLDCSTLSSGTYFCRLEAGNVSMTREIVVVK